MINIKDYILNKFIFKTKKWEVKMTALKETKIKGGTVDYGRIYEQRVAAHLAIKSALDPDVSDFWMLGNIDGVEAFDDIVLMIEDQAGNKKIYCIQLKHSENNKSWQAIHLESKSNRVNFRKYEESFQIIEKNLDADKVPLLKGITLDELYLILWTNAPLTGKEKMQQLHAELVGGMDFLTTSPLDVYKMRNKPTSETTYDETFLEKFFFFEKQASAVGMEKIIKDELFSHFGDISNSVVIAVTDYFAKWSVGDKRMLQKITKSDMQRKLLEFILFPHLIEPYQNEDVNSEKFDLINDSLITFNLIPITKPTLLQNVFSCNKFVLNKLCRSCLNLKIPWSTNLSKEQYDTLKTIGDTETQEMFRKILLNKKIFVPHLTIRDVYLAAWQCRLIPLIINCNVPNNLVEKILVKFELVTKDLSFVLLNPDVSYFKSSLKIFNINGIEDNELKNRNLETASVSLQNKEAMKLEVFKDNTDILAAVTPDVYLMLMEGTINLGETSEIESYYVKRDLRRPILRLDLLGENKILKDRESMFNQAGDIFLLVECDGQIPMKYRRCAMELTQYLADDTYLENEQLNILFTDMTDFDPKVTISVLYLHKEAKKSVHVIKLNNNCLEWSFSKGSVETLQKHLIETSLIKNEQQEYNIPEDDILKCSRSNVNIISNNAGMGKTFMLKSISNKFDPKEWVFYINLSEHVEQIQANSIETYFANLFQYTIQKHDPCIRNFCNKIFVNCIQTQKSVFLFDGYDEVSSTKVLELLKSTKEFGVKVWITTRPTYQRELEIAMENLSTQITHFSSEDHVTFLWKYFHSNHNIYHYDDTQIQYIIDTIHKSSTRLDKTFIALPLQTRMFAEIFGDDINQISEKGNMTMVDLYNKFIDVKLKDYKSYEATSLKKTLSKLALKLFFTKEQLDDLLDFEDLAEEAATFQESYKKDSIVIGLNEKGDAVFGHRSFAEFLAAHWLSKQIVKSKSGYNLTWLPLLEKLYYIEMVPVRVFFDRMVSQNLPLHIAVMNNDLEKVKELLKEKQFRDELDTLGRSALHLAVTYGKYYDLYVASEIKGLRNVGLHSVMRNSNGNCRLRIPLLEEQQYQISGEIVDELLNQDFTNTADNLFRYDLFDYAMKSCSLNSIHKLFEKFDKLTIHFEIGFSFEIFLYCIVHDNLYRILSNRKTYNFDVLEEKQNKLRAMFKDYNFSLLSIKYNDMYLTEVAALTGAKETLFELIQSGALQLEDGSALHKACFAGHSDIIELLCKMGADIEKSDNSNWSSLYQAVRKGRGDLVYQLLSDSKFLSKSQKVTDMSPLHFATQGGHIDCVKKLIEYGARVYTKDTYETTPLVYASKYGHADIIEFLLKSGHIDITDDTVRSIINVVASHGYSDIIKVLLKFGFYPNNVDNEGNTPLVIASKKGFSNVVVELAADRRCNLDLMVHNESRSSLQMWCAGHNHIMLHTKLFLIKRDHHLKGGVGALHFATRHGHSDCVKTLLNLGADMHMKDEITSYTPLIWAVMYGQETVVKILLDHAIDDEDKIKAGRDAEMGLIWACILGYDKCMETLCNYLDEFKINPADDEDNQKRVNEFIKAEFALDHWYIRENENMPLVLAAKNGYVNVLKALLSRKYRDNYGLEEALHWAARNGHLDCVKELIKEGAEENKKNEKFLRLLPISWACMNGKTDVVTYFLSNKTSEYLKNQDLHTALHWAALGGHYGCVKLLLNFGLDVDYVDPELKGTPLACACEHRGTVEVIDALMEKNCKVNVTNADGHTTLELSARKKNFEFVKRFINSGAFNDLEIEESSDLYKNLQYALEWALKNEEILLIEKLVGFGIKNIENK